MLIINQDQSHSITLSVRDARLEIGVDTGSGIENFSFGHNLTNGAWHTAEIKPIAGSLLGIVDNENDEELLEEDSVFNNLDEYIKNSEIIIGASRGSSSSEYRNHLKACLSELRVADILLPYFNESELVNTTTQERFVLESGLWSGDGVRRGECVLCQQEECVNGGVCADPAEQFHCSCPPGFTGPTCAVNIDECEDNDCDHGSCVDGVGNYTCSCDLGWTGDLCDTDHDECLDSPCANGATCQETVEPGDYNCTCLPEFIGKNCEELRIKTCDQRPCVNGGFCVDVERPGSSDQYKCDCRPGYTGFNCQEEEDYCQVLGGRCENGGTCVSDIKSLVSLIPLSDYIFYYSFTLL